MRHCVWLFVCAMVISPAAVKADDTKEFLDPKNWEGRSDIWKIEDGKVIGETKEDPKYNTFFCSKAKYGDFELSCKIKLVNGKGNSGIQIRSERMDMDKDPKPFRVKGPQVDVGAGYWGSLYGEGIGGMMKQSKKEDIEKAVKDKEENLFHVVAKGTKIKISINGTVMVDDDFPKLPGKGDTKPTPTTGIIAFQAHAGAANTPMRVEFSEIKFTILK